MRQLGDKKFYDEKEAQALLGYTSRVSTWRLRRSGRLVGYRMGKGWHYEELDLLKCAESFRVLPPFVRAA